MAHSVYAKQGRYDANHLPPLCLCLTTLSKADFTLLFKRKKTDTVAWKPEQLKQNLCHYGNLTRISSLRGLDAPVTARRFPVFLATIGGFSDAR